MLPGASVPSPLAPLPFVLPLDDIGNVAKSTCKRRLVAQSFSVWAGAPRNLGSIPGRSQSPEWLGPT